MVINKRRHDSKQDIKTESLKNLETWNTCPDCSKSWKSKTVKGILHRTTVCKECWKKIGM